MAFTEQKLSKEEQETFDSVWKPLEVTGPAIPWTVLGATGENEKCIEHKDGGRECFLEPEYAEQVKVLDGTEVTLMGFMFPLDQTEEQHTFLIGPYPLSCPFHYHVGPSQVVEVLSPEGVEFSYDPVMLTGILSLRYNEETGVFYYLENAQVEKKL